MVSLSPFDRLRVTGKVIKKTVMVSASFASSRTILRESPHDTALDKQDDNVFTVWATAAGHVAGTAAL